MRPLLRASHLQPTVAVTVIATVLSVAAGRGGGSVAVALAVLSGQLSVGWSNDVLDRDRDRRAGRTDKPIAAGEISARRVAIAAALAAAATVPLSLLSGWRAGIVHVGAVAVAWLYNLGVKSTIASPLPFGLAFGALPAFVTLGLPGHPLPPPWATAAAALLGTGAHFVNTVPDLADDERAGVRGLPHRLGATQTVVVGTSLLGLATLVLVVAPPGSPGWPSAVVAALTLVAVIGVAVAALSGRGRVAWSLVLIAATLAVVTLVLQGRDLAA